MRLTQKIFGKRTETSFQTLRKSCKFECYNTMHNILVTSTGSGNEKILIFGRGYSKFIIGGFYSKFIIGGF